MFKSKGTTLERFMSHVEKVTESGCWIWMASIGSGGYGKFGVGARPGKKLSQGSVSRAAHQVAYELMFGPIPEGMDLDHLCRVRCCVNPQHLEPVTHQENCRRGIAAEVATARNRAKTHCPRGHEYTPENTFVTQGGRKCKACRVIFDQERFQERGRWYSGTGRRPKSRSEGESDLRSENLTDSVTCAVQRWT